MVNFPEGKADIVNKTNDTKENYEENGKQNG